MLDVALRILEMRSRDGKRGRLFVACPRSCGLIFKIWKEWGAAVDEKSSVNSTRGSKKNILQLLEKASFVKDFNAVLQDKDGNNLLAFSCEINIQAINLSDLQKLKNTVPPYYQEMRNKKGYTPEELFWKEHTEMLATSEAIHEEKQQDPACYLNTSSDVGVSAGLCSPGGFDQLNAEHLRFLVHHSSNFPEREFFMLPRLLRISMCALLLSILFVISAFLSAFFLIFVSTEKRSSGIYASSLLVARPWNFVPVYKGNTQDQPSRVLSPD
ncbi:hypothetical protein SASPL_155586 [Salvia splendens]|uniref:Uncharacterized protein n=1 Tax=Salvia splendens TaxID=180675 RepID=A0A8X8VY79_SALSN|nr:hypothetical protein SASPL_155586 [Salvia splendens]